MAYVMITDKKIRGSTMVQRTIIGVCEPKEIDKKMEMLKRVYPNEKIKVFKEVKLSSLGGAWK